MIAHSLLRLIAVGVFVMPACAAPAPLSFDRLRCESLREPAGIDLARPRLSWTYSSAEKDQLPTHCELLVATSLDLLNKNQADAWRSGPLELHGLPFVEYAGEPFKTHMKYWWKVRAWGEGQEPSPWSEPAQFGVGVLQANGWNAKWIGKEVPPQKAYLTDAKWIWSQADVIAPPGECYFRRVVNIPTDRKLTGATFRIAADDRVSIYLDGREIGSRSGPNSTKEMDLTHRLKPGANLLAVVATNEGEAPSSAGLVAWLRMEFDAGEPELVVSDESWTCVTKAETDWQQPEFDASKWSAAQVIGPVGCEPWGPVQCAESRRLAARQMRREFTVDKPVRSAMVSLCGLGLSELSLNGKKVGDHELSPALSQYPETSFYVTHDVTGQVQQGRNAIGVLLGNGRFYAPRSQVYAAMPSFGSPKMLLLMTIHFVDGSQQTIVSDQSWKLTDAGPIVANNEYDGEEYDARRELTGWNEPEYDDIQWSAAEVLAAPSKRIVAQPCEPIRITERIRPKSVTPRGDGVYQFDLGQNIVGHCLLRACGGAGNRITLRYAETLQPDGSLYLANLRGAKATDVYICRGDGIEICRPRFTTHGFRYVEVSGCKEPLTQEMLSGCVVHDDLEPVGEFACSEELINRIYENVRWGTRGNYRSIPTDCPQRDERQGWLGDRLEVARGESYLFDVQAFYRKWLGDIRDSQLPTGSLPDVAPAHWPLYTDNVVWPSAAFTVPDMLRTQYGDERPLREQYESLQRWTAFMRPFVADGLIARDKYGDWCVPPEEPTLIHSLDPARTMNTTLLASLFFAHDLDLLSQYARLVGEASEAKQLAAEAAAMRGAIHAKYWDAAHGQYDNGMQSTAVLALALGACPASERDVLAKQFARKIEVDNGGHIGTGLVGGQYLCRTLTKIGRPDLVLRLLTNRDYPSWGYMVDQGATTVWELWNGNTADPAMNSGNHVMLVGDLVTWLYEDLAGIAPAAPGFQRVRLAPQFVAGIDWVRAAHDSPYGKIRSEWRREAQDVVWRVTVPPGASATVQLPAGAQEIGSGSYEFRVKP